MNYIAQNEELERAETYLKSLSDYLKETYEERGKYFFVGRLAYLMTAEVIVSFLLLGIMIAKSVPIAIAIILFLFTIAFFTSLALYGEDILKKAKLPIVSNICEIKVGKKDWIEYEIVFPSSIDSRFTGRIAKPRFIKRKRDGQYIGICSYEYKVDDYELEDKILGIDIGKIKLFSSVVMDKNGEFSNEFINTKRSQKTEDKINRLYENKQILYNKIKSYEDLRLTNQPKYEIWQNLYLNITNKIINTKDYQAKLLSSEIVKLALEQKCKTIHIEDLSWLNSQGGKWNHSQIHSKIIEKASMYGIEVKKVSAFNTSKEHPITKEVGVIQDRTVEFTTGKIDRDLLAAINIAIRSTNIKLKKSLPKKVKTKRVKPKSNKKEIKEKVNKIKGNGQIVSFLTNVLDSTIQVELGVRPLSEVLPCNSLIDYYNKLHL